MYTHIVKRQSGYLAGWLDNEAEAEAFAHLCNVYVPSDPAHVERIPDWPEDFICAHCGQAMTWQAGVWACGH